MKLIYRITVNGEYCHVKVKRARAVSSTTLDYMFACNKEGHVYLCGVSIVGLLGEIPQRLNDPHGKRPSLQLFGLQTATRIAEERIG